MTAADPGAASTGALAGLRVLEIAGPLGEYAGKLLADFGADVVLVEPPAGAARRHLGPFIDDQPGTERSLSFAYLNTSKRGVTLDLDQADGQAIFTRLARSADVVLDGTGQPGLMSKRGLGYEALAAGHPQLVYTAVTPFGSDGPYAGYQATDIIVMAMGGLLSLGGYGDGDPVRAGGDQACLAAGQFAAVGTLLAVLSAEQAGVGQFVDVSAQQAVVMAHENAVQYYDLEKVIRHRNGGDVRQAAVGMYQCQDGYVYVLAKGLGEFWKQLVDWLEAEQIEGAASLRDPRWQSDEFAASPEGKAEFAEIFGRLAANRTKAQLHEAAKRARIPLSPVNNPANLVASPQLAAREYFVTVEHPPTGRALLMPGAPVRLTASPAAVQRPAPALGQHNLELLGELGLTPEDAVHLAAAAVI